MQFGDASIPNTFEDGTILSSPIAQSCIPFLKKNSNRGMDHFQENILDRLHEHTFFSIISNTICNLHHVHLRAWFFKHLTIP
jgi:hypothetical protein